jgi:hypothetical protein
MICEDCEGEGVIKMTTADGGLMIAPCLSCIGGIASCCDAAGSRARAEALYADPNFCARPCDHCGQWYRGPAVYCSLQCAEADA